MKTQAFYLVLDKAAEMCGGQNALARRLDVEHSVMAKYRGGKRSVPNDVIRKLAELLGENPADLWVIAQDARNPFRQEEPVDKVEFTASRPLLRMVTQLLASAPTTVKLQPDRIEGVNAIFSTTHDAVSVNNQMGLQQWRSSVIVPFKGEVLAWACARFEDLRREDFDALMVYQPELVIFGSGSKIRFVHPSLIRTLIDARIGVECMDTLAACRTYNVLASENRRVVAALLMG